MAVANSSVERDFKAWLVEELNNSGLDGEVYGDYIIGALDEEEDEGRAGEEIKISELEDLLSGALEATRDCNTLCQSIVEKWSEIKRNSSDRKPKLSDSGDPGYILKEHIKTSKQATPIVPPTDQPPSSSSALSATEKNRLLMQYGSCTGDDDDDDHELHDVDELAANTNKMSVSSALKEMREDQKRAHKLKTEKDRENRKVQQQKQQERKEKEKKRTQKQERKR